MRISVFGILFFIQIVISTTLIGNLVSWNLVSHMSTRRKGVDTNRERLKAFSKKGGLFHKNYDRRNQKRYYRPEVLNHPLPIADRVEEGEIVEGLEGEGFLVENEGILNER